ncbi:hypothetical protein [Rugosimonospora africana]|nr:hypothetical protein [Rugosimonospora africana]
MLKTLMAERFERPYLDRDMVASLEYSAAHLMHLQDTTWPLHESAMALKGLEDSASLLIDSANVFRGFEYHVETLRQAATVLERSGFDEVGRDLSRLEAVAERLTSASTSLTTHSGTAKALEQAAENLAFHGRGPTLDVQEKRRFFGWGTLVGVLAVVLVQVLAIVLTK